MTFIAMQSLVADLVRDKDHILADATRDTAIAQAVIAYSAASPRELVEDVIAEGTRTLALPARWESGLSILRCVEYPIGWVPACSPEVRLYAAPDGWRLAFDAPIAAGEAVRVTYTAPHRLDDAQDTIPGHHFHAVACLAAADLCGQLQAHYASEGMPTISADSADHQGKSERYRTRRRDLLAEYNATVGAPPADRVKPASAVAHPPRRDALGGTRLFHPVRQWPAA